MTLSLLEILPASLNLPPKAKTDQMKFVQLEPIKMDKVTFVLVDTFWASMRHFSQHPPSWQGFMSQLTKETSQCTTVIYNPMLPLNPQTNEAVYSTMLDVMQQAKQIEICASLTFDQPLYLKASRIKVFFPACSCISVAFIC